LKKLQVEVKKVDVKKVLGLIYKHYEFLENFLPKGEGVNEPSRYTLTQLVNKTGKDITYLSKLTDKLEKAGLLEISEEPRERGGRPYKVSSLSDLGLKLLTAIEGAIKPVEAAREIEPWKIAECLNVMEDDMWSEDVRYKFACLFFTIVSSDPVQALSKCDDLKRRVEGWVAAPPLNDRIDERIRATISVSITRLIKDEAMKGWVLSKLYPKMLKLLQHSDPIAQVWAISMLANVAINTDLRVEVADIFLNTLLNRRVEELEGKVFQEMLIQLSGLVGLSTGDEKRSLLAKLKTKAKEESKKQTAEYILDRLMASILD
jgi:DNA-binding MarR family transcriptional regulator